MSSRRCPGPIRNRLRDLDDNIQEPRIFANDILQGRFGPASRSAVSSSIRSSASADLFDVATAGGLPKQSGDFGQTLFVWGVPAGTYL